MAAAIEWLCGDETERSPAGKPGHGHVKVHLGMLFVDNVKLCNLRKDLAGPPERGEHGEVLLRLIGGRWGSLAFDTPCEADALERTCRSFWLRASKADGQGLAPALARLMEAAATPDGPGAGEGRGRSRSRSAEPRRRRLLRRLSSVEVEGMWRLQHAEDLEAERSQCEKRQREAIVEERAKRPVMTRAEFMESLRKEAELQQKIQAAEEEEREERKRFEALRAEEATLFMSLREVEQEAPATAGAEVAPAVTATAAAAPAAADAAEPGATTATALVAAKPCTAVVENNDNRAERCVICQDAQRCVVFLPCKHLVCCAECGHGQRRLEQCPMCRARVVWRFKVFI